MTTYTIIDESLGPAARMSAEEYLDTYKDALKPHRIVIGAAIAGPTKDKPSVLVVQRSAHERSYPNEWEIPGGHTKLKERIAGTVVREVQEETSLVVTKIFNEFPGFSYWSTKYESDESDDVNDTTRSICTQQLNFCVEVRDISALKLNPDEHQNYAWCTMDTVDQFKMTGPMRKVVVNAIEALSR